VVITSGRGAARLHLDGLDVAVAPRVDVVDTVGAGDTVSGALLTALGDHGALGDRPAARLDALDAATLREVLAWAAASAAITCSREGAQPPSRAEVSALLAG
jgi:fructokinase